MSELSHDANTLNAAALFNLRGCSLPSCCNEVFFRVNNESLIIQRWDNNGDKLIVVLYWQWHAVMCNSAFGLVSMTVARQCQIANISQYITPSPVFVFN